MISKQDVIQSNAKVRHLHQKWQQILGAERLLSDEMGAYSDEIRALTWQVPETGAVVRVRDDDSGNVVTRDASEVSAAARRLAEIQQEKRSLAERKNALAERARVYAQLVENCVSYLQQQTEGDHNAR